MSRDADKSSSLPGPDKQEPAQPPQRRRWPLWSGLAVTGLIALAVVVLALSPAKRPPPQAWSATPAPTRSTTAVPAASLHAIAVTAAAPAATRFAAPTPRKSWILLPPMPATATQADIGAEIYRLVCGTCHGFAGEGLSYGPWVKTSAENCWQAKCHGVGHAPGGFELPRYIPPLIGPGKLTHFQNALALYQYVRATMPWYAPGTMLDEEYWEVTAFLVRANGDDPIQKPLDAQRAAEVTLR